MSLVDDIKRDVEAGTPGPWEISDERGVMGSRLIYSEDKYGIGEVWDISGSSENEPNARRTARVPEMEARILADAERLKAADELIEVILDLQEALSEARQGQTVNMGAHEISAYRALQGGDA